jgi:hypothetical protein
MWPTWPKVEGREKVSSVKGATTRTVSTRAVSTQRSISGVVDGARVGDHGVPRVTPCGRACVARPPGQLHLGVHPALKLKASRYGGDHPQPGVGHQIGLVEAHPARLMAGGADSKCLP